MKNIRADLSNKNTFILLSFPLKFVEKIQRIRGRENENECLYYALVNMYMIRRLKQKGNRNRLFRDVGNIN